MPKTKKKDTSRNMPKIVIYGIQDLSGNLVYVGKTKNFQNRSQNYLYPSGCHNSALKNWLLSNRWEFIILEENPIDLDIAEKLYINKHKSTLFNMVNGGEQNWRHHTRMPWMARIGVKCPSDMLLHFLLNRGSKHYKKVKYDVFELRNKMSIKERINYELSLAMDCDYGQFAKNISLWLSYTEERILGVLQ